MKFYYNNGFQNEEEVEKILTEAFRSEPSISELYLSGNDINSHQITTITGVLKDHPSLTQLWLDHNKISEKGAVLLSKGLMSKSALKVLNLDSNEINDSGARELGKLLCNNKGLDISLASNAVSAEFMNSFNIVREVKHTGTEADLEKVCTETGLNKSTLYDAYSAEIIDMGFMDEKSHLAIKNFISQVKGYKAQVEAYAAPYVAIAVPYVALGAEYAAIGLEYTAQGLSYVASTMHDGISKICDAYTSQNAEL